MIISIDAEKVHKFNIHLQKKKNKKNFPESGHIGNLLQHEGLMCQTHN